MSKDRRLWILVCFAGCLGLLCLQACADEDLEARFEQGRDLVFENRYADAEGHYLAIGRDMGRSQRPDAFVYRASALFEAGRIEHLYLKRPRQAVRRMREAIKLHPQADFAFPARKLIADIFLDQLRDYRSAALEFERLVHDFPDRLDADRFQYRVAQCYFLLKDYDQARTEARILLNRWPEGLFAHQARLLLANAYYLEGKLEDAAKAHAQLLAANPDDSVRARSQFELGMCHQELGDLAQAEKVFLEVLKAHPRPDLVQMQLASLRKHIAESEDSATPLASPTAGKVYVPPPRAKEKEEAKAKPKAKPEPKAVPEKESETTPASNAEVAAPPAPKSEAESEPKALKTEGDSSPTP